MTTSDFALLDRLRVEGITAGGLAAESNRTGRGVAADPRRLRQRGFVQHDGGSPRTYGPTEKGRAYVDA